MKCVIMANQTLFSSVEYAKHVCYSTFQVKFDGKFVVVNSDQYMKCLSIRLKAKNPFDQDQWMRKGHDTFW